MRYSQLIWSVSVDGHWVERGSRISNYRGSWSPNPDWRKALRGCLEFYKDLKPVLHLRRFTVQISRRFNTATERKKSKWLPD